MISDEIYEYVENALEYAGFTAIREYEGDVMPRGFSSAEYPAIAAVKSTELGEMFNDGGELRCCADVTFSLRLCGEKRGFYDAHTLAQMCEKAVMRMYFFSKLIIKKIVCGQPQKNMQLGRLEQCLEVCFETDVSMKEVEGL